MTAFTPMFARLCGLALAAAITASCSTVTGGTAISQHSGAPSSANATAPTNSVAAPPPPPVPSAEDQIRQTIFAFQDAYNTQNWDAYTELMCSAMRAEFTGPTMDYLKKGRAQNGLTTVTITSIVVTGATATAAMNAQNEALGSGSFTLPLKLEDGWKICKV
jgi:hypothetical protein